MKPNLLILGLALTSCFAINEAEKTSEKSAGNSKRSVILDGFDFNLEEKDELSKASITSLNYDASSHKVKLTLEYKACGILQHALVFSGVCAESYPAQCGAALVHGSTSGVNCDKVQQEDMEVTLKEDQDEMVLIITTQGKQSSRILVDRTGRVKKATTPPEP